MPIDILPVPNNDETRHRIEEVLQAQARTQGSPPFEAELFAFEARDGNTWIGGIAGYIVQRWMYVELLAVSPNARGERLGARLMEVAERRARERDLVGVWLDSFSFQAPEFYAKLGYEEFGRLADFPPGYARVFFAKRLDGRPVYPGPADQKAGTTSSPR